MDKPFGSSHILNIECYLSPGREVLLQSSCSFLRTWKYVSPPLQVIYSKYALQFHKHNSYETWHFFPPKTFFSEGIVLLLITVICFSCKIKIFFSLYKILKYWWNNIHCKADISSYNSFKFSCLVRTYCFLP